MKSVCVIGAGVSGLVVTKELLARGLSVDCYEKMPLLGGVFGSHVWSMGRLTSYLDRALFSEISGINTLWKNVMHPGMGDALILVGFSRPHQINLVTDAHDDVGPHAPHPHDGDAPVPDRLPAAELRALSALSPVRALLAISVEWLGIGVAITTATLIDAWPATLAAIVFIGARQHALLIIAHDAAHFRLLPDRRLNDWVGNLLLAWPTFISVQGFRHYHGPHHRFLNEEGDGNRELWHTHGPDGQLAPEWRYPKTPLGLAWKLLRRAAVLTGLFWALRGLVGGFLFGASFAAQVVRVLLWAAFFTILARAHAFGGFLLYWVVPYCTWHVAAQYTRLVCEHSAVRSGDPRYAKTRTTIPGPLARLLLLPRNIGYHLEHHFYPSVPFYRLPELHARLAEQPVYATHAVVKRSVWAALRECTGG